MGSYGNRSYGLGTDPVATVVASYRVGLGGVTKGEFVKLSLSEAGITGGERAKTVIQGTGEGTTLGIALETALEGETCAVAVKGYVEGALTDGTVALDDCIMATAAGACTPYLAASVLPPIGVAMETDTGTACDVYLYGLMMDI